MRAYAWLEAAVLATPVQFLADQKRKVIKSIFTHSLFLAINDPLNKLEQLKVSAIKISAKIYKAVKLKKKDEYEQLILNHILKIMMEDEKESIR